MVSTEDGTIVWNVGLERIRGMLHVRMPDESGAIPAMRDGFLVSWPVNPAFTGRSGIQLILEAYAKRGDAPLSGEVFAS